MTDDHYTRTEPAGGPDDSKPSDFGGLTEAAGLGPATPDKDFLIGQVIGGVTIVRLIAEGGMGRVYEGLQDKPRRPVAVKVMRPGFVSREACRRFDHEAEVLGKLRHPCIAQIYSAGIYDMMGAPVPYFVMEYIPDALPITKFATQHSLNTEQRLQLFREVCEAVAEGHKQGIVHRDLKPSNILVERSTAADRAGSPKIIDFGVARSIDAAPEAMTGMTDMGRLIGTLQYMSPEQFVADPAGVDVRADVYALGVILYELLTGRPPYEIHHQQIFEAARIVREQAPQPVMAANRSVGSAVAQVADTCLRKDPRHRYANASELAGAVQACLDGAPSTGRLPPRVAANATPASAMAWLRKAWPYVLACAGVVLVAMLFGKGGGTPKAVVPSTATVSPPNSTGAGIASSPTASTPVEPSIVGAVTTVTLDNGYEGKQARLKRRDAEVPRRLVGYPQEYLICGTENEPYRDRETGELVVPLQLSFDRKKYLAMARDLATLLKVDDDRCGKVTCDGTAWQTVHVGVTTSEEMAERKKRHGGNSFFWEGPFGIKQFDGSPPGRYGEIFPTHRGWGELHAYVDKHSPPDQTGLGHYRNFPGIILILLTDVSEDFSRTNWEWFHVSKEEVTDLFGGVRTRWRTKGDWRPATLECITVARGPDSQVLASDTLPLAGPGLKRLTPEYDETPFAILAPFHVELTERFDIEGAPIDWYVPHWFIERRLKLPEAVPATLSVTTSLVPLNRVPNAAGLQMATNSVGMTLVQIPDGTVRKTLDSFLPLKGRVVPVRLGKRYWMGQTEVTNGQWQAVMGEPYVPASASASKREELLKAGRKKPRTRPVMLSAHAEDVAQVREFCERLTAMDREKGLISADEEYALPTECQWEHAFLAGEDEAAVAWRRRSQEFDWAGVRGHDAQHLPFPVGLLRPNAWGLFDMDGNLAEICDNGADSRKRAGQTSDDPAYAKWTAFTDSEKQDPQIHAPQSVVKGGHCWDHAVGRSKVGFRVIRIDTRDP